MKIIIDTNIVISGLFFGGYPRLIIESVVNNKIEAVASIEIIKEYKEVIYRYKNRTSFSLNDRLTKVFFHCLNIIHTSTKLNVCRDKDDDKFIECAVDAHAHYVVSGDKDLLSLEEYEDITIITAKDFCEQFVK